MVTELRKPHEHDRVDRNHLASGLAVRVAERVGRLLKAAGVVKHKARRQLQHTARASRVGWVARDHVHLGGPARVVRDQLGGVLLARDVQRRLKVRWILEPDEVVLGNDKVVHESKAVDLHDLRGRRAELLGAKGATVPRCHGARVPGCQGARVPGGAFEESGARMLWAQSY